MRSPADILRRHGHGPTLQRARMAVLAPGLRLTRRWRPLPDFLVVGVQKSATTSVFRWLAAHPDVAPALVKEVHFFDHNWSRGPDWYRGHFPLRAGRRRGRLTGEASPSYVFHPLVPGRVRQTLPDARLIALLRNPVDRAYSHYQHGVRWGYEPLSFEAALEREPERLRGERRRLARDPDHDARRLLRYSYQARGRYAEQLERWLALFPREQLLVLESSRLTSDPQGAFEAVQRFLGLRPVPLATRVRHHAYSYPPMHPATRARLVEQFRPQNERLYQLLGRSFAWDR
ncbi:MAG: sulfotransferase domain-containing protein [Gemmatimonadota bacterium]